MPGIKPQSCSEDFLFFTHNYTVVWDSCLYPDFTFSAIIFCAFFFVAISFDCTVFHLLSFIIHYRTILAAPQMAKIALMYRFFEDMSIVNITKTAGENSGEAYSTSQVGLAVTSAHKIAMEPQDHLKYE